MERRFTFDAVAELYETSRPGYPDALFDQIVRHSRLNAGDAVLEIGCGTGRATRPFAERGYRITALEPGANLRNIARRSLANLSNLEIVATTFEDWPLQAGRFKLIFAAQSFHWITPEQQFSKPAHALTNGGVLAVFGNTVMPIGPPLGEEIQGVYARLAPSLLENEFARTWYLPGGGLAQMFDALPMPLTASAHFGYSWNKPYSADAFAGYLCTQSSHQLLPAPQRDALLSEIRAAIAARDGQITLQIETHLYMATRQG